jgi:hypothetical protein
MIDNMAVVANDHHRSRKLLRLNSLGHDAINGREVRVSLGLNASSCGEQDN